MVGPLLRFAAAGLLLWSLGCDRGERVEPGRGRVVGGDTVRITGEGFSAHGPPIVYFGPRAAKAVVIESDRLITAMTPEADAPGEVDVSIRYPDGTIFERPAAFSYEDGGLVLRASDR
jgi:IPT/TIG domain-containing protein